MLAGHVAVTLLEVALEPVQMEGHRNSFKFAFHQLVNSLRAVSLLLKYYLRALSDMLEYFFKTLGDQLLSIHGEHV